MVLTAPAAPDASGNVYQQVFLYSTDDQTLQQLTFDPTNKNLAFMWQAPEYNNSYAFLTVPGDSTEVDIYAYLPNTNGSSSWQIIKRIQGTPDYPYIDSPEPFVYQGESWIFFSVLSEPRQPGAYAPSQIAISGVEPGVSSLRVLTADVAPVIHTRRDPEYYITANGPYIYYNRVLLSAGAPLSEGVFRVDAGLGPPQVPATRRAVRAER
jgi:hypothetical protein